MDQLYWICPSVIALLTVYLLIAHQRRKQRFLNDETVTPLRDFAFKHQLRFQKRQELEEELGREHIVAGDYHGRPLVLRYRDGISEENTIVDLFAQRPWGQSVQIKHLAIAASDNIDTMRYPDFELWFKVSGGDATTRGVLIGNETVRKLLMLALPLEVGEAQINISKKGRVRLRTTKPIDLTQLDLVVTMLETLAEQVEQQASNFDKIKETLGIDAKADEDENQKLENNDEGAQSS